MLQTMRILSCLSVVAFPTLVTSSSLESKNNVEDLLQWEQLVENGNWASLDKDSQFVRVPTTNGMMNQATEEAISRYLEQSSSSSSTSNHYSDYLKATGTGFEYSANAEYEQYQLAWRYLGMSIDCSVTADQRGGSHDDEDDEDQSCARVLLYAVYVDFDYEDDAGLAQYQFYNRKTGRWVGCGVNYYGNNKNNKAAEEYGYANNGYGYNKGGYYGNMNNKNYGYGGEEEEAAEEENAGGEEEAEEAYYGYGGRNLGNNNNGNRCVQMDCHLQDTHYTLLGVFKNLQPESWMEQLFKHEGICVWTDDEYAIAQSVRKSLPEKCTPIGYEGSGDRNKEDQEGDENENGNQNQNIVGEGLYYHMKPEMGGNIGLGLYTDAACTIEYSGGLTLDDVVLGNYELCDSYQGYNATGMYYDEYLEDCGKDSPSLLYQYKEKFNDAMNIYKQCQSCVAYNLNEQDYQCDDDAGYTNCMQCMKFKEKADSLPAFASDLLLASRMNSMLAIDINGIRYGYGGYTSGVAVGLDGDFAYSAEVDRELEAKYAKAAHHGGPMGGAFYYCSIGALVCSILFFIKVKFIDDFTSKRQGNGDKNQPLLESNGGDLS